jgi:hypothetical protein
MDAHLRDRQHNGDGNARLPDQVTKSVPARELGPLGKASKLCPADLCVRNNWRGADRLRQAARVFTDA